MRAHTHARTHAQYYKRDIYVFVVAVIITCTSIIFWGYTPE